jgi:hypothetical protein
MKSISVSIRPLSLLDTLLVNGDNLFISQRNQLAALTARYAVTTIYGDRPPQRRAPPPTASRRR